MQEKIYNMDIHNREKHLVDTDSFLIRIFRRKQVRSLSSEKSQIESKKIELAIS